MKKLLKIVASVLGVLVGVAIILAVAGLCLE
jgi:hypothetical protein